MGHESRLRFKTLVMVLAMVVCGNVGDLLLKRAMTSVGAIQLTADGIVHALRVIISTPMVFVALSFLICFMICYMTVLSWADYSYVMPAGAFGYAVLTFCAVVFLHETVSFRRWIGVVIICVGVMLVGQTKPRTTEVAPVQPKVAA